MHEPWASAPSPQQPWEQSPSATPQPLASGGPGHRALALLLGAAAALVLVSGAGGFFLGQATAGDDSGDAEKADSVAPVVSPLQAAFDACESRDSANTLSLEDGGTTIVVNTRSKYGDRTGLECVLHQLDVPQSITAQMDRTTALMGVQDAESDGIEYSWSYHPDNGVNMVITAAGGN